MAPWLVPRGYLKGRQKHRRCGEADPIKKFKYRTLFINSKSPAISISDAALQAIPVLV